MDVLGLSISCEGFGCLIVVDGTRLNVKSHDRSRGIAELARMECTRQSHSMLEVLAAARGSRTMRSGDGEGRFERVETLPVTRCLPSALSP